MNLIHEKILKSNAEFMETISWYTLDGYKDFNKRLRQEKKLTDEQTHHLLIFDRIFSLIDPITYPIVAYKGIKDDKYESDKSFISTSISEKEAYEFTSGNCCVIQLNISAGSKVLYIENVSEFGEEKEIILDRNGQILITGQEQLYPKTKIYATYIPQCSIGIHEIQSAEKAVDLKEIADRIRSIFIPEEYELYEKSDFELEIKKTYKIITGKTPSSDIVELLYRKIIQE